MLGAELVLEDEAPRSALTQSKPKAGNIIVKENRFGFACGQLCCLHSRRCQFHGAPPKSSQSSQVAGLSGHQSLRLLTAADAGKIMGRLQMTIPVHPCRD